MSKTFSLAALSAANLVAGVTLPLAGVLLLGAGPATDAYFVAQTVPMILGSLLASALINNLAPLLAALGREEGGALVGTVMLQLALLATLLFGVLGLTAPAWIPWMFFGLVPESSTVAVTLAPVMCAIFAVNVVAAAGTAGYYARRDYLFVEASQLCVTLLALSLTYVAVRDYGIIGFCYLLLGRATANLAVMGSRHAFSARLLAQAGSRLLWGRVFQILSGSVIFKLGPVVDRVLASLAAPGMLTSLSIGQQVAGSTSGFVDRVLARPLLVSVGARDLTGESCAELAKSYRRQLRHVLLAGAAVTFAAFVAIAAIAGGIVPELPFLRSLGRIDVIVLAALTAIPAAAGQLSSSLMYGLGSTREISRLAIISFAASSTVKVVGFFLFGVYAIVAGMFLYQALNWWLMHVAAIRKLRGESGEIRTLGLR